MSEILLWSNYKIYFYDEDNGTDYVGDFMNELADEDEEKASEIFLGFFERIENGIGIPSEWKSKKVKKLNLNKNVDEIWEYRDKSSKNQKLIRIYFGICKKRKILVFLDGHFKENNEKQKRKIDGKIVERWKDFKNSECR